MTQKIRNQVKSQEDISNEMKKTKPREKTKISINKKHIKWKKNYTKIHKFNLNTMKIIRKKKIGKYYAIIQEVSNKHEN